MNAFIVFDVSSREAEIRNGLQSLGYYFSWLPGTGENRIYYLPKNSMWKPNWELAQAKTDLANVISKLNAQVNSVQIVLQRCIILSVNPWDGIEGIPVQL